MKRMNFVRVIVKSVFADVKDNEVNYGYLYLAILIASGTCYDEITHHECYETVPFSMTALQRYG